MSTEKRKQVRGFAITLAVLKKWYISTKIKKRNKQKTRKQLEQDLELEKLRKKVDRIILKNKDDATSKKTIDAYNNALTKRQNAEKLKEEKRAEEINKQWESIDKAYKKRLLKSFDIINIKSPDDLLRLAKERLEAKERQ